MTPHDVRPIPSTAVIYDKVVTNIGSSYNPSDGTFTAPRAGTYLFIWNSMTYSKHFCRLYLYKNGANIGISAYGDGPSDKSASGSMSVVLGLAVGDRLWIQPDECGYLYGAQYTSFTGCKI